MPAGGRPGVCQEAWVIKFTQWFQSGSGRLRPARCSQKPNFAQSQSSNCGARQKLRHTMPAAPEASREPRRGLITRRERDVNLFASAPAR